MVTLPNCFFFVLKDYLVPVPRCISRVACIDRNFRNFAGEFVRNLIKKRIFYNHLHIETRKASLRSFSRFIHRHFRYEYQEVVVIFRRTFEDMLLKKEAIEMLISACDRFSYLLFIREFLACNDKRLFCYNCRGQSLTNVTRRDATTCPYVQHMLVHMNNYHRVVALFILRPFSARLSVRTRHFIERLQSSVNAEVAIQAELCVCAWRAGSSSSSQ